MTHLNPAEIVDAVEGRPAPDTTLHLRDCERCREEVARAAATLNELRSDRIQDPSPLFWEHFSRRVGERVGAAPAPISRAPWMRWVWAPAAVVAIAIAVGISLKPPRESESTFRAASVPPATADVAGADDSDENWAIVAESAEGFDWRETAEPEFMVRPGAAERAAMQLSDDEQKELARLLQEEISRL